MLKRNILGNSTLMSYGKSKIIVRSCLLKLPNTNYHYKPLFLRQRDIAQKVCKTQFEF